VRGRAGEAAGETAGETAVVINCCGLGVGAQVVGEQDVDNVDGRLGWLVNSARDLSGPKACKRSTEGVWGK